MALGVEIGIMHFAIFSTVLVLVVKLSKFYLTILERSSAEIGPYDVEIGSRWSGDH